MSEQTIDDLIDPNAGKVAQPDDAAPDVVEDDGEEALGDAGKQALDRMKAKLKAERDRRVAAEARAVAPPADETDLDAIRREAETAALGKANGRIIRAEVRAAAASKLTDPADALNFLDLSVFEVDEDGDVDQDDIAEAIADLIKRKPYLAAQGGTTAAKPDRSQGATGNGVATNAQRFERSLEGIL